MSTQKAVRIRVEGLDAFRKELRKLDDAGLMDELKAVNQKVAELVVTKAKLRAQFVGAQAAKAAESMKASRQAARSVVAGGGRRSAFFGGAEFGSVQFPQFKAWQGNGRNAGYFLYPTIRESTDEIVELYGDEIDKITRRAFPD